MTRRTDECPYTDNPTLAAPWHVGWEHERDGLPYATPPEWSAEQSAAYARGRRNQQDHATALKRAQGEALLAAAAARPVTPPPKASEASAPKPPPTCGHPTVAWSIVTGRWRCRWCDEVAAARAQNSDRELVETIQALCRLGYLDGEDSPAEFIAEHADDWLDGLAGTPEWAEGLPPSTTRLRLAASASRLAAALLDFEADSDYDSAQEDRLVEALAEVQVQALYVEAGLGGLPVLSVRRALIAGRKAELTQGELFPDVTTNVAERMVYTGLLTPEDVAALSRAVAGYQPDWAPPMQPEDNAADAAEGVPDERS